MDGNVAIPADHIHFDDSGRAIISHPETVARLRRALLREGIAIEDSRCDPMSFYEEVTAASSPDNVADSKRFTTSEIISRIRGMTFASPTLVQGIRPDASDPKLATAKMRFGPRGIFPLGPILDAGTPDDIRAQIEASEFSGQVSFGAKPYASAFRESIPATRYVLEKIAHACKELFGTEFDENELIVAVCVHYRERYVQLQGAHIDWTKGAEFREDEWHRPNFSHKETNTLRSLETRHSLDCVLGGPPTDFFLDEQTATIHLHRNDDGRWIISAIDFSGLKSPQAGLSGEVFFRPGYTIHQFPLAEKWTSPSKMRLFVSCDYSCSRLSGYGKVP